MGAARQERSEEERGALIARARDMIARDGIAKFSLRALSAETGIARSTLHRRFGGKQALLAAILEGNVAALSGIAELAAPDKPVPSALSPSVPHSPDAWLERRLRVFERALAALETRQEKFDATLSSLHRLDETLGGFSQRVAAAEARIEEAITQLAEARAALAIRFPEKPRLAPLADARLPEPQLPFMAPAPEEAAPPAPDSIAARESFILEARRVAQAAVAIEPEEPQKGVSPWLMGLAWIALAIAIGVLASRFILWPSPSPTPAPASATAHRHVGLVPDRRLIARADSGDAVAQYLLGTRYLQDDPRAALRWLASASALGNRKAMHNLAIAYALGKGTPPDPAAAARWFARAAAMGYVDSAFDLAVLYERGEGVGQNLAEACKWYFIAAGEGDAESAAHLQVLRAQMSAEDFAAARTEAGTFSPLPYDRAANGITGGIAGG